MIISIAFSRKRFRFRLNFILESCRVVELPWDTFNVEVKALAKNFDPISGKATKREKKWYALSLSRQNRTVSFESRCCRNNIRVNNILVAYLHIWEHWFEKKSEDLSSHPSFVCFGRLAGQSGCQFSIFISILNQF